MNKITDPVGPNDPNLRHPYSNDAATPQLTNDGTATPERDFAQEAKEIKEILNRPHKHDFRCTQCDKSPEEATPEPELNVEVELKRVLTKEVLGSVMVMVNNCYENMDTAEFEDFLFDYSKRRHKFEPENDRCDGCNGVDTATDALLALIQQVSNQRVREFSESLASKRVSIKPGRGEPAHDVVHWFEIRQTLSDYLSHKEAK